MMRAFLCRSEDDGLFVGFGVAETVFDKQGKIVLLAPWPVAPRYGDQASSTHGWACVIAKAKRPDMRGVLFAGVGSACGESRLLHHLQQRLRINAEQKHQHRNTQQHDSSGMLPPVQRRIMA